jgi:hypothetical protein
VRSVDYQIENNEAVTTQGLISLSFTVVGICLALLIPVVMADSVPRDRALKVWDILHTSSMRNETYLVGKVLGGVAAVMAGVMLVALVVGITWWLLISQFEFGTYLQVWLVGAAGMAFINIGLVTLISAPLGNRRLAVILAIFFCFAFPILVSFEPRHDWLDLLNPVRPGIFFRYAEILEPTQEALPMLLTLLGGAFQVVVAGVLVNWWMHGHEGA